MKTLLISLLLLLGSCSINKSTPSEEFVHSSEQLQKQRVATLILQIDNQNVFRDGYRKVVETISDLSDVKYVRINKNVSDKEYFIIKFYYFDDMVQLIFRTKDLYLLGFIGRSNIYYYFSDSSIIKIPGTIANKNLGYTGSYISLGMPGVYTGANLGSYITMLETFNGNQPTTLKKALSTIIFSTAEAFRFKSVANALMAIIGTTKTMNSALYEDDVKNWQTLSQKALRNDAPAVKKINIAKKY